MNSSAALEKNANRSASSQYPYSRSRPKKFSAEYGSVEKHLRPRTKAKHNVQWTSPPDHGTCKSRKLGCRPQISEYRMLPYFGRMISTAFPLSSNSRLRPDTTSPRP